MFKYSIRTYILLSSLVIKKKCTESTEGWGGGSDYQDGFEYVSVAKAVNREDKRSRR